MTFTSFLMVMHAVLASSMGGGYRVAHHGPEAVVIDARCGWCGHTWTYRRPRHYGGSAFQNLRCPNCTKT